MENKPTALEEFPTDLEAEEENSRSTIPEEIPTDPEGPRDEGTTPEDVSHTSPDPNGIYPNQLLRSIPEGAELP